MPFYFKFRHFDRHENSTDVFLRTVPTNLKIFSPVCDYAENVDLNKSYWNPKRKLG